jgi:5-methylcytosine-specific restriction protein A
MSKSSRSRGRVGAFEEPGFHNDQDRQSFLKREREEARRLQKTPWWQSKIQSGQCSYCQSIFLPADLTMDHALPLSLGGRSSKSNLVPACKACNTKKSDQSLLDQVLS